MYDSTRHSESGTLTFAWTHGFYRIMIIMIMC